MAAVHEIGLPSADSVLDLGEGEYGYHVMKAGYKGFVDRDAVLHHGIRGYRTITPVKVQPGGTTLIIHEFAPIRCYCSCRNILYFMLYDFDGGCLRLLRRAVSGPAILTLRFLVRPQHLGPFLRGIWYGVTGDIAARY
jgi:hypothetical protein